MSNALRNAYYLDISGKVVTGGEAMRNYQVVPQPGDSAQELLRKLAVLKTKFQGDLEDYKEMYPILPDLGSARAAPAKAPEAAGASSVATPNSEEEFKNLPSGSLFRDPNGNVRIKR